MNIVNTYHVSYPDLDQREAAFLAVLVSSHGGLKVYSAIVHLPPVDTPIYEKVRQEKAAVVVRRGNPENYARAVTFFPGIKREEYRA